MATADDGNVGTKDCCCVLPSMEGKTWRGGSRKAMEWVTENEEAG